MSPNSTTASTPLFYDAELQKRFRNAFLTEIGYELQQRISLRELVDLVICAGRDVTLNELKRAHISVSEYDQQVFSFEDSFEIFKGIPAEVSEISDAFEPFIFGGGTRKLDFASIISFLKERGEDPEVITWLKIQQESGNDIDEMNEEIVNRKSRLEKLNAQIVEHGDTDEDLHITNKFSGNRRESMNARDGRKTPLFKIGSSCSEQSLSSIFSRKNVGERESTACPGNSSGSKHPLSSTVDPPVRKDNNKVELKGLIIQKNRKLANTFTYQFAIKRTMKLRVSLRVNEKIDSALSRFHNSLIGVIVAQDCIDTDPKILGVTKHRGGKDAVVTEWIQLQPGIYTLWTRFCRPIKVTDPQNKEYIIDAASGKLTKTFKVMLMNLFDMFDLDDDGLLNFSEFDSYSRLSGGPVDQEGWKSVFQRFCKSNSKNPCVGMRQFIDMHQEESRTCIENQSNIDSMWNAVRELGHNQKFYVSTACPILVDFELAEPESFELKGCNVGEMQEGDLLDVATVRYFWDNSTPLNCKEVTNSLIRQFKTDYFLAVLAGSKNEQADYLLDLSISNNVNIDKENNNDWILKRTVPKETIKLLTVALAQSDNWFLSVRLKAPS